MNLQLYSIVYSEPALIICLLWYLEFQLFKSSVLINASLLMVIMLSRDALCLLFIDGYSAHRLSTP